MRPQREAETKLLEERERERDSCYLCESVRLSSVRQQCL